MSKSLSVVGRVGTSLSVIWVLSSSSVAWAEQAKVASPTPPSQALPVTAPTKPAAPSAAEIQAAARKAEVETARARCTALLKNIAAVTIAKDPIEEGDCGALAPVELISVGKNPEVALSPPAVLNCDMVVAIHDWIKTEIQPLAKKHLKQEVVRIETMSSYACRNAYGRKMSKLSEHGKANALDIRGFVTAKGETAYVLEDWGMTSREIREAAAQAEKEQAERAVAAAAAAAKAQVEAQARAVVAAAKSAAATAGGTATATASGAVPGQVPNPIAGATTLMEGLPKAVITLGPVPNKPGSPDFGLTGPSKLGGPKKKLTEVATAPPAAAPGSPVGGAPAEARSFFMRAVHESACRRFGTTLGPEANAAHRNHFHVDLAERKSKGICE